VATIYSGPVMTLIVPGEQRRRYINAVKAKMLDRFVADAIKVSSESCPPIGGALTIISAPFDRLHTEFCNALVTVVSEEFGLNGFKSLFYDV